MDADDGRFRMEPGSAYEMVTRHMVERLAGDVKEIRDRINNLFWIIAATFVLDLLSKMAGIG